MPHNQPVKDMLALLRIMAAYVREFSYTGNPDYLLTINNSQYECFGLLDDFRGQLDSAIQGVTTCSSNGIPTRSLKSCLSTEANGTPKASLNRNLKSGTGR